jgi:hypothetical protein
MFGKGQGTQKLIGLISKATWIEESPSLVNLPGIRDGSQKPPSQFLGNFMG